MEEQEDSGLPDQLIPDQVISRIFGLGAQGLTRRQMMYRMGQVAATMGLANFLIACGAGSSSSGKATLTWIQFDAIADASFRTGFTDATVKTINVPQENAMAAQIKSGQVRGDVTIISQAYAQNYWFPLDVLQPLNPADYSNFADLFPYWQNSQYFHHNGQLMGIPQIWGSDSIIYNTKKISSVDSVAILWDPSLKGQISMSSNGDETVAIAGQYIGAKDPFNPTDSELAAMKAALLKQKPLVRNYWQSIGDLVNVFTSGEVAVAHGFLGAYTQIKAAGVPVAWANPKEGQIGWANGDAILKGTQNMTAAKEFMNFIISPSFTAPLYSKLGYRTSNQKFTASLTPQQRSDLQLDNPDALLNALVPWVTPPGDLHQKISDVWTAVQSA